MKGGCDWRKKARIILSIIMMVMRGKRSPRDDGRALVIVLECGRVGSMPDGEDEIDVAWWWSCHGGAVKLVQ